MANTTKGYPYPADNAATDVPGDVQLLAEAVDAAPGIASLTQAQIDALAVAQKWAGRVIWNQTTLTLQRSDGGAFTDVGSPLSSATPAAATTAGTAGTSTNVARGDHAHPATAPTPAAGDSSTKIATTAFVQTALALQATLDGGAAGTTAWDTIIDGGAA